MITIHMRASAATPEEARAQLAIAVGHVNDGAATGNLRTADGKGYDFNVATEPEAPASAAAVQSLSDPRD